MAKHDHWSYGMLAADVPMPFLEPIIDLKHSAIGNTLEPPPLLFNSL